MAINILAVDDEPDVRHLISTKLKKAGFEVVTAVNGQDGVEKALSQKPDVVLMDVMMPVTDGFAAVAQIKKQMKPAPMVLMLTAKGEGDDVKTGMEAGADDYIVKPFVPSDMIDRVKVALIKAGRQDDLPT